MRLLLTFLKTKAGKVAEASCLSSSNIQRKDASATPRFTESQIHWLGVINNHVALMGKAFAEANLAMMKGRNSP